jgi:hypothetical protein
MARYWFIIGIIIRIEAVLLTDRQAVADTACNVARRGIELTGQLIDAMNGTSLSGNGVAYFSIIAIHLYFTACCSRLGGQTRDNAIGCFAMARVDDANTTVVAYLFTGAGAIKDQEDAMWCVAIAIHQLGDEGVTSCCEVPRFYVLERGTIFDDVVAIDKDISAHGFASCFLLYPTTE